jgi:hypothetical protein
MFESALLAFAAFVVAVVGAKLIDATVHKTRDTSHTDNIQIEYYPAIKFVLCSFHKIKRCFLISSAKIQHFFELCKEKGGKVWFGGDF